MTGTQKVVLHPEPVDGPLPRRLRLAPALVQIRVEGALLERVDPHVIEEIRDALLRRDVDRVGTRLIVVRGDPLECRERHAYVRGDAVAVGVHRVVLLEGLVHRHVRAQVVAHHGHELAEQVRLRED
jgi:hypothetical protein